MALLLDSMLDYLPGVPHVTFLTPSGPSASKFVPCETCRAQGRVRVRSGWRLCLVCDGTGEKVRSFGDPPWDMYMGMPLTDAMMLYEASLDTPSVRAQCRARAGSDDMFAWERRRLMYERAGSYRSLERAIEKMRVEYPDGYESLRRRFYWGTASSIELENRAVVWLAREMRSVRVPRWIAPRASMRDRALALSAQGFGVGSIGKMLNVKRVTVRRWVRKK